MAFSEYERKTQLETVWLEKLRGAQGRYCLAMAHARAVQAEYESMSRADGDRALEKSLCLQNHAVGEFTRVLHAFTQLVVHGRVPDEHDIAAPVREEYP